MTEDITPLERRILDAVLPLVHENDHEYGDARFAEGWQGGYEAGREYERGRQVDLTYGSSCPSCAHVIAWHNENGCLHMAGQTAPGKKLACPCSVTIAQLLAFDAKINAGWKFGYPPEGLPPRYPNGAEKCSCSGVGPGDGTCRIHNCPTCREPWRVHPRKATGEAVCP